MNIFTKISLALSGIVIGAVILMGYFLNEGVKKAITHYEKADTTITCKNSKCDTIITKRSL